MILTTRRGRRRDVMPRVVLDLCSLGGFCSHGSKSCCTQLKELLQTTTPVSRVNKNMPVFVADIKNNLLGLDYFWETKAVLDFGDMTMRVGDLQVPLLEESSDV